MAAEEDTMDVVTYDCRDCLVGDGLRFEVKDGKWYAWPCETCNPRAHATWAGGMKKRTTPTEERQVRTWHDSL